jgi:hypothetical protein
MEEQTLPLNAPPDASPPEAPAETHSPEIPPADFTRQYYFDAVGALVADASKSNTLRLLVGAMTWNLARIIVDCGTMAAGDVLAQLGSSIAYIDECERAAKEAGEAREAGQLPH